jgi:hypothetical protein
MELTQPAVSVAVDESTERLWLEWLSYYFDGQVHRVAGSDELFPLVRIHCGQHGPLAVQEGVSLSYHLELGEAEWWAADREDAEEPAERTVRAPARWCFYVRASVRSPGVSGANAGNGAHLCRRVAELLGALWRDPSRTIELARVGITELRPGRARPLPGNLYALRELVLHGRLQYLVPALRGTVTTVTLQSDNGSWYLVQAGERFTGGEWGGTFLVDDQPVAAAGEYPYLVVLHSGTGLKHAVRVVQSALSGTPTLWVDPAPVSEALRGPVDWVLGSGRRYGLSIVDREGEAVWALTRMD